MSTPIICRCSYAIPRCAPGSRSELGVGLAGADRYELHAVGARGETVLVTADENHRVAGAQRRSGVAEHLTSHPLYGGPTSHAREEREERGRVIVEVGLFCAFRNPPPWARPPEQLYADCLEQIRFAEELGFDGVWIGEHHFTDDGFAPS